MSPFHLDPRIRDRVIRNQQDDESKVVQGGGRFLPGEEEGYLAGKASLGQALSSALGD